MQNSAPGSTLVLGSLLVGAACGSLLGFLLGGLRSNPDPTLDEPPVSGARESDLERVLSRLEGHLELLADRIGETQPRVAPFRADSPRKPIPTQSFEELPQLVELLERLNATLVRLESSPARSRPAGLSDQASRAPAGMSAHEMAQVLSDEQFGDFAQSLQFLSYDEVLARLGRPSRVGTPAGGQNWYYSPPDDPHFPQGIGFMVQIRDGFVVGVVPQ